MATVQNDLISGSIGDRTYSVDPITRKQIVRSKPKKVRNPKTAAQKAHRSAFVDIVRLSSHTTEAHLIGLFQHARRNGLRTYADFRRLNKDCFTPDGLIDYPRLVLSHGTVSPVDVTDVHIDASNLLHLTFETNTTLTNAHATDLLFLFAYSAAHGAGILAQPVLRTDGSLLLQLPTDWSPADLHLYAFLCNSRGFASNTLYIPLPR